MFSHFIYFLILLHGFVTSNGTPLQFLMHDEYPYCKKATEVVCTNYCKNEHGFSMKPCLKRKSARQADG